MKNLTTSNILILLTSIIIAFFVGRYSVPSNNSSSAKLAPKEDVLTGKGMSSDDEAKLNEVAMAKKKTEAAAKEKEEAEAKRLAEAEKKKATEEAGKSNAPLADKGNLERPKMGISDNKIEQVLTSIAENLEAKKLPYVSSLMQDCSGIFHQMKDSLQNRLPALAQNKGAYLYPSPSSVRNTRQIADWYHKNNNLLIVEDAMAARNSIRPGSVMFYGKSNKTFKNITIDMLTDRANNYTSNGAIMHIAVVTSVTTDKEGDVVDYTIMHGRNPRNHASRTGSKAVQSTRTPNLPPFGNWSQQLVAIANIATPAS